MLLELQIYSYLNRVQTNRPLEQERQRNVVLMRLGSRLVPDARTIAD